MSVSHDHPSESFDAASDAAGDLLSDVLDTVRLRGAVFFRWEPSWPFATSVPNGRNVAPALRAGVDQIVSYHIVLDGPCWGAVNDEPPVRLDSGDILLIPRGDAYVISNTPQSPDLSMGDAVIAFFEQLARGALPPVVVDGGEGPEKNRLICGFLSCDMQPFNPLLNTLPRLLKIPAAMNAGDPLSTMMDLAMAETTRGGVGKRSMLLRLSELMFVEVIRRQLSTDTAASGDWLACLRDPVVARALSLLHRRVAEPWTLERLAREVGTSRSTLAERFAAGTGEPPMQYLARWRMQVAAHTLSEQHDKVFAVAQSVGYESEAAFSRAFKRIVGMTPSQWRSHRTHSGDA